MHLFRSLLAIGLLTWPVHERHSATCTIVSMGWIKSSVANRFIVTPLKERIAAGAWIQDRWTFQATRADTVAVYGQLLAVDTVLGPDAQLLEHAFHQLGRPVVVVIPWDIGSACERRAWQRDSAYL